MPQYFLTSDENSRVNLIEDYPKLQDISIEQKVQADKPALSQWLQRAAEQGL